MGKIHHFPTDLDDVTPRLEKMVRTKPRKMSKNKLREKYKRFHQQKGK